MLYDKLFLVDTEEYPSLAEGIGLENRQAGHTARGFESLFLLHSYFIIAHKTGDKGSLHLCNGFFFWKIVCFCKIHKKESTYWFNQYVLFLYLEFLLISLQHHGILSWRLHCFLQRQWYPYQ